MRAAQRAPPDSLLVAVVAVVVVDGSKRQVGELPAALIGSNREFTVVMVISL